MVIGLQYFWQYVSQPFVILSDLKNMSSLNNSIRKLFLFGPYSPSHAQNRMQQEGDLETARNNFLKRRFNNLDFLLKERYSWMNQYLNVDQKILEICCGAGFSELYLTYKPTMSDASLNEWVDLKIDATNIGLPDSSYDIIIASHNIHHFHSPYKFFMECQRVLKPGGFILIQELHTSLLMRIFLRLMRHEGWSYNVNVFDINEIANDPNDLWSANCAIPELLFKNHDEFEKNFPKLKIVNHKMSECLIFPLSGGVISKVKVPEISSVILKLLLGLDKLLITVAPNFFALGQSLAIKKI